MKHYLKYIIGFVGMLCIAPSVAMAAASCSSLGITVGASCYMGNVADTILISSQCMSSTSGCKYKECSNGCSCLNTACSTSSTTCPGVTCDETVKWSLTMRGAVYQTGTLNTLNTSTCTCQNKTVYRCAPGRYSTTSSNQMQMFCMRPTIGTPTKNDYYTGTSAPSESTCKPCPGDALEVSSHNYCGNTIETCYYPSYTNLTDDTGTYMYTSPCYYSE